MYAGILVYFTCILLHIWLRANLEPTAVQLINQNKIDNLSCHYIIDGDALELINPHHFQPPHKSIFFHDTDCKDGLNSRQMCAVESAARLHPKRNIYVFFSGPVTVKQFKHISFLHKFTNIHFGRILILSYSEGTPLESLVKKGLLNNTFWGIENTSNVLRFLTLYKWSGVYLDFDTVVVKSFDRLPENWIARQDDGQLNCAAIALSDNDIGRGMAYEFIEELARSYKSDIWINNGPGVVNRVLIEICGSSNISSMSVTTCQGFPVIDSKLIYPIHYSDRKKYFLPGKPEDTPDAVIHHIWNRLTHIYDVPKNSLYSRLAEEFCPSVFKLYGANFGT
ncbi:unnamed protein product [Leptidea sinapis]|uniref:Alpha 1,4-glycosyltransferase domain-containing protein n=1 Tax=Leptidea sinapis TaxID=189913 RepID=A0A5E4PNG5_9NEOP|nr:unnamed protein product [Leptidea sinapis]